jgi:hypothetical protein
MLRLSLLVVFAASRLFLTYTAMPMPHVPLLRPSRVTAEAVAVQYGDALLDLLCLLTTLVWALLFRRPIRAVYAVLGALLEELGAADAVDVVLSTDF